VRCGRCGNENAEGNRFCGMCGATLVGKTEAAAAAPKTPPAISGTSILGLSTPGPAVDRHREVAEARDPLQPSSRNLDYLLEDEEEPKRSWGKSILIVAALALAVGFGYLYWKQGGFDWLTGSEKKPAATADGQAAPAGGAPTPSVATTPTESAAPAATPAQTPAQDAAPPSATAQNIPAQNPAVDSNASANAPANAASQPVVSDSDKPSPPAEVAPITKHAARKPAVVKPAATAPYDVVREAERYIYGRGARQDCDHGMRLLKRAAEQANPKAMISMGTLYSTGTCTPRDLPTAYRWFALALHKQPDNQALQDDLKNLWEKMTQPERQLAIKLSQ
jgi:hypothetical protein